MQPSTSKKVSGIGLLLGAALFGLLSLQRIPPREALIGVSGPLASLTPMRLRDSATIVA